MNSTADMAKKAQHYADAERLFVQDRLSVEEIAGRIPVSSRTIGDWRREYGWDARREKLAETNSKTHEKLYTLIQTLTDKAIESAANGEEPSQSQLYFIGKMAPLLLKLQSYEEASQKPSEEGVTEETVAEQKRVLGELKETAMRLGLA